MTVEIVCEPVGPLRHTADSVLSAVGRHSVMRSTRNAEQIRVLVCQLAADVCDEIPVVNMSHSRDLWCAVFRRRLSSGQLGWVDVLVAFGWNATDIASNGYWLAEQSDDPYVLDRLRHDAAQYLYPLLAQYGIAFEVWRSLVYGEVGPQYGEMKRFPEMPEDGEV
jgi:hypothetical protein